MMSPPCQESAPTYLPAYTFPRCGISEDEEEKEKEDCQGQTANTGKNITKLLETFTEKEEYEIQDVFVCFVCIIYLFNSQYQYFLNSNETFPCKP